MANDEFGDFQTPIALVQEIISVLLERDFARILEPTCGIGNFLRVAREYFPTAELKGIEIQEHYAIAARQYAEVITANAMDVDFAAELTWKENGPLLIVGNPPWVTNATLTDLGSDNKPKLENIRKLKGLDAVTGAANFDIAEAIILRLISEFLEQSPTLALLCKTQVARNVLSYCDQFDLGVKGSQIYEIDAKKWFNAGVDACLFILDLEPGAENYRADVYSSLNSRLSEKSIGVINGRLVADVLKYLETKAADGESPIVWRQGIKHDATQVMELVEDQGPHRKTGEAVDIESDYLFPLLKCTDVFRGRTKELKKWMVVPQRHTSDDTTKLQFLAPRTWSYLLANASDLDGRKSSIYRNRSRFCIFGVGDYSFAPYKVAISAMHKQPIFRLVAPILGRVVVFDDVCYLASFKTIEEAAIVAAILASAPSQALIESLIFTDSKRPITKKLLQRLDLRILAQLTPSLELAKSAQTLCAESGTKSELSDLKSILLQMTLEWADTREELQLAMDFESANA